MKNLTRNTANGNLNNGTHSGNLNNGIHPSPDSASGIPPAGGSAARAFETLPFHLAHTPGQPAALATPQADPLPTPTEAAILPLTDLLHRLRDRHGNRLPWFFSHSIVLPEDVPLDKTPYAKTLAIIEDAYPGRSHRLHHVYDHQILPAVRAVRTVIAAEIDKVAQAAHAVRTAARQIEVEQAALRGQRDAATQGDRDALLASDKPLSQAHGEVARTVSQTGGLFDPASPISEVCALRVTPRPLEVLAHETSLPFPEREISWAAHAVSWACTLVIGVMVGISMGVMGKFLDSQALGRAPLPALLFAIIGIAIAVAGKKAMSGWVSVLSEWFHISDWFHVGSGWRRLWPFGLATLLLVSLVLIGDGAAERSGLLSAITRDELLKALSGGRKLAPATGASLDPTFWLVPILATLGYVGSSCYAGWRAGTAHAVRNRLLALQEREVRHADETRRALPEVQAALHRLSLVADVRRQQAMLGGRIAETARPFDAKIAWWEAQRQEAPSGLPEAALARIQDAADDAKGAMMNWEQELFELLDGCEPVAGNLGRRLAKAFRGSRAPRAQGREGKKRLS